MNKQTSKSRMITYCLILVFVGPLVVACLLYGFRNQLHFNTQQHGHLFTPPLHSNTVGLKTDALGKWQLLYIEPAVCDDACRTQQYYMKQIHTALHKHQKRLALKILASHTAPKHLTERAFFLIDPNGWMVMEYPLNAPPKGILEDIRRLLRYSHG